MAMFVKCVWMRELECWGMVLRSPLYSACGVVLMLRGVGWCACSIAAWVVWILHRLRLKMVSLECRYGLVM